MYILSEPEGCSLLKMTRPIEKVTRRNTIQISILTFDILNFIVLGVIAFYKTKLYIENSSSKKSLEILAIFCLVAFATTILFYLLTLMNPGYVSKQKDFIKLLEKIIYERYHLDYVCVHCENLRPENADHCNFCNRCVQKFDHHCVFVNNCLGYRNHKWFLLFLFFFTFFMLGIFCYCLDNLITIALTYPHPLHPTFNKLDIALDVYLILIVLLHSPIVIL